MLDTPGHELRGCRHGTYIWPKTPSRTVLGGSNNSYARHTAVSARSDSWVDGLPKT